MNNLHEAMDAARARAVEAAEGVENHKGRDLVDNPTYRVGLEMLTPGADHAEGVDTPRIARSIGRWLVDMATALKE